MVRDTGTRDALPLLAFASERSTMWIQDPWTGESVLTTVEAPDQSLWDATQVSDYEQALQEEFPPPLGVLTILVWGFESLFEFLLLVLWRNLAQKLQHDLRLVALHQATASGHQGLVQGGDAPHQPDNGEPGQPAAGARRGRGRLSLVHGAYSVSRLRSSRRLARKRVKRAATAPSITRWS